MKKVLIWGNVNSDERMELIFDTLIKMNYEVVFVSTKNALWNTIKTVEFIYIPPMEHRVYKFLLSSILGKRIMCDIYAPLYDTTVNDYKIYKHFHPIAILHYLRDYVAMRYSKPVIFLNEAEAEHFIKSVRVKKEKVMYKVLPLYRKEKKKAQLPYYNKENGKLTLCWTGTYIPLQGVEKIIDAVKILKKQDFNFRLLIFGPDNERASLYKKLVKESSVDDRVQFINVWGNINEWEKYICKECDIALGIFGDSDKAKTVIANKVIDATAFMIPIITGISKGLKNYFDCTDDIVCIQNTPQSIAESIIAMSKKTNVEIQCLITKAYHVYQTTFNEKAFVTRFEGIIDEFYK